MALAKLSNEIISIRGRFGGVYFKKSPDGQHIQAWPRLVNYTRSPAQRGGFGPFSPFLGFGIEGYSGSAALWLAALIATFGAAWAAYAIAYVFSKPGKEGKHISGYNWYIYYALAFAECEHPPFWKPPHSPGDLPAYIVAYRGRWQYEHAPDEWPAEACGDYYWEGIGWQGKPSYKTDDFNWHIWWRGDLWVVSPGPGFEPEGLTYYRTELENGSKITGYYKNPVTKKLAHVYFGSPESRENPP